MLNELLRKILFLPQQRSTVALGIDALHYFVIIITMLGATAVAAFAGFFMYRYRRRGKDVHAAHPDATKRPPFFLELGAIGTLFGLFLLWWFIGVRQYDHLRVPPEDALTIYVTGKQWMWKFAYPEGPSSITTLYVPARRPVKLVMTSRDMIHSFYVPDFRVKYDVVPGRYTTLWFEATHPGAYPILCAEYCGTGHSVMRGQVVAMEPADYEHWLAGKPLNAAVAGPVYQPPSLPLSDPPDQPLSLVRMGENIAAEEGCLRCHTPDGTPHIGPTWAGLYKSTVPLEGGGTTVADEAYITESIMDPRAKVHRGFSPVMPSFLGLLEPAQTAAIVEYIKSLADVAPKPGSREPPPGGPPFVPAVPGTVAPQSGERAVGPVKGGAEGAEVK